MPSLEDRLAGTAGFPDCAECAELHTASPDLCLRCARQTCTAVAVPACPTCAQPLPAGAVCRNDLCRQGADRHYTTVTSVFMKTSPLEGKIHRYKYSDAYGWAGIFARLLVAHLNLNLFDYLGVDHIVACPGHRAAPPDAAQPMSLGHTELVLHLADQEDQPPRTWTWDNVFDPTIVKDSPTPSSAGAGILQRRDNAGRLREALRVVHPDRVAGRHVLVYDDVFTTGRTVNEVARALQSAGATRVDVVVLARQPWL